MRNKNNKKGKINDSIDIQNNVEKLQVLKELKFESVGEEYVYLYESITIQVSKSENIFNPILDSVKELSKNGWSPSIEELRDFYKQINEFQKEEVDGAESENYDKELKEKYEKNSIYWSDAQEKAIVEYVTETDGEKRNLIFSKKIYKPLKKLVENIIFTYKLFRTDVEVTELQSDCMSFLITKIDKFNPKTGAKAFAYLGTIAKHYLMGEKRIAYKHTKINVDIDENLEEASEKPGSIYNLDDLECEESENVLFNDVIKKIEEEMKKPKMLTNDKKVAEAIVWIFKNHEMLKVYNKNLVYHLLKERTGLQTKEITYSLSRLKSFYRLFKKDFIKNLD